MPRKPKSSSQTEIDALKHNESTRVNIPTPETSGFLTDEQQSGEEMTYPRYRRDPSLDPQLVWRGKDEQDTDDLRVFVKPIYVTEKIQPKAIIEVLKTHAAEGTPFNLSLFDDFNGIDFEAAVDFYQHEQHWTNRLILGDSLAVMASLAEKEGLRGKVQMIYMDPPYGIRFNSNWQPSTIKRDVKDGKDVTYEPEQIRAFRDTWEQGIHSYLGYLRDRLRVARELLTESGSIFVQIGDENIHLVRSLMDEVFGRENFCSQITFSKTGGTSSGLISSVADYLLWYAKNAQTVKYRQIYLTKSAGAEGATGYTFVEDNSAMDWRSMSQEERDDIANIAPSLHVFDGTPLMSPGVTERGLVPFEFQGKQYQPPTNSHWKTSIEGIVRLASANRIIGIGNRIEYKRYLDDFPVYPLNNIWLGLGERGFVGQRVYVVQTDRKVIERCLLMTTDPGDLVLDPTCGSGTTAYVAEQWGRRWITMDTSRVALALARTRLMAARFPSYRLKGQQVSDGFIYKTVPHITLKSIANNPQIDVIHERWQPDLDTLRAEINAAAGAHWQEWEIPRPNPAATESPLQTMLVQWWQMRRTRQAEIDKAIRDSAEMETLYDQPEVKSKAVRVTGPFTVESLQPHRAQEVDKRRDVEAENAARFVGDIIEHLRVSGVTNARKGERMLFSQIDAYHGRYIHAAGSFEQAGQVGRVAVFIGPQYGTVSREMIEKAALETSALKPDGVRFDMLLVCGFAFDPFVTEEVKKYGRLVVQTTRISPDVLLMGRDLKKDDRSNLFTVFGEPDVEIVEEPDGRLVVRLLGVDVYDPGQGQIRSSSTNEVACWFIDTAYDEHSFFVRHAYFTGADRPYDKLKGALKAEIDPGAWEALYLTESIPFARPESGRVAIKVINHHGDEVMKVCVV